MHFFEFVVTRKEGIINVVAALTIPALVSKYQERVIVTALKKNFSILSQAYKMAI